MVSAVLLEWWMWSCQCSDPVERSGPALEVKWCLSRAPVLWEFSGGPFLIFQTSDYIKECLVLPSEQRVSWWGDVILWVMLRDLEGPLAEMDIPGWFLLPWGSYQGWVMEEIKSTAPPILAAYVNGSRIPISGCILHCSPREQITKFFPEEM